MSTATASPKSRTAVKRPVVKEEIRVTKEAHTEDRTASGTVRKEKADIEKDARKHEEQYKKHNEASEKALHPHHNLAISMTLLQIAIALASITVLTQKRWLLWGAAFAGLSGAALAIVAYVI